MVVFALVLTGSYAFAGYCASCHTMHNSQNGSVVAIGGPYGYLLKGNCWGCHADGASAVAITADGRPLVYSGAATDLAGGNFAYGLVGAKVLDAGDAIATTSSSKHNVSYLGSADAVLTTPPGDQFGGNNATINGTTSNLGCAGTLGCHGIRTTAGDDAAMKGSHHNDGVGTRDSTTVVVGSTGTGYRFLDGVFGYEDSDWQNTSSATDHNEYFGATAPAAGTISSPGGSTISGFCNECHGYFHGSAANETGGSASPWLRHPTDIVVPNSGEYSAISTTYNLTVPVARTTEAALASASGTIAAGTDAVMCLSCHKAHGSANADILRWNYSTVNAGAGSDTTRCFVCHTTKDTP